MSIGILLRRVGCSLVMGCVGGLTAFALDQLLAWVFLGHAILVTPELALAYPVTGMILALAVEIAARRRAEAWGARRLLAATTAAVYAIAVFDRVFSHAWALLTRLAAVFPRLLEPPVPLVFRFGAGLAALAAFGLWIALLARLAGRRHLTPVFLVAAVMAAVVLAANHHLFGDPGSAASLVTDAGILAASLGVARLLRTGGPWRAAAVAVAMLAAVAGVIRWPPAGTATASAQEHPHLILIVLDTLRLDTFDAVVRETAEGQAFERALAGSAWFTHAVATSPWTMPSMGSILTGLYPSEHGLEMERYGEDRYLQPMLQTVPSLADQLGRRGYLTEALVANYLLTPASGISRGFGHYEIVGGPSESLPLLLALARTGLPQRREASAGALRLELERRLGKIARSRPLFLWLHFMDCHQPLRPHRGLSPDPAAAGLGELERLYRDEVRYLLRELTRIFALLRAHDLWDSAVLAVVSDHGEMFPSDGHNNGVPARGEVEPLLYGHGHALYDELMRVPLVIRPPGGMPATRRVGVLTSLADLRDTFLDLLRVEVPRAVGERISLAPWLAAVPPPAPPPERGAALIGSPIHGPDQRGWRSASQKLIEYVGDQRPPELYDLASDPKEARNLAAVEPERLAAAARRLESLWSRLEKPPEAAPAEVDPETLRRLRALGYVE